jgi:hypothetical protein
MIEPIAFLVFAIVGLCVCVVVGYELWFRP